MTIDNNSPSPSTEAVVCLITTPRGDAHSIAAAIVEGRLAACVNIIPLVRSLYWWEGKVQEDEEALLVAKTTQAAIARLEELLRKIHPYDTFELVSLDIRDGSHPYLQWLTGAVTPSPRVSDT